MCGGLELSSERPELEGPRGYRPGRPLLPALAVHADHEEPQAERSLTDERGSWIQGTSWAANPGARRSAKL